MKGVAEVIINKGKNFSFIYKKNLLNFLFRLITESGMAQDSPYMTESKIHQHRRFCNLNSLSSKIVFVCTSICCIYITCYWTVCFDTGR